MQTVLSSAFFALFVYLLWLLAAWLWSKATRSRRPENTRYRVVAAGVAAFVVAGIGGATQDVPTESGTPSRPVAAETLASTTATTPGTTPAAVVLASTVKATKEREASAARRSANRAKARARARHDRYVARRKSQNRAKAKAKNEAARAAALKRQQSAAAAAAATPPATPSASYAGMTCAEIGHSFTVVPGSDMDHDANGDGVACESE